jgi:hypothetical protein
MEKKRVRLRTPNGGKMVLGFVELRIANNRRDTREPTLPLSEELISNALVKDNAAAWASALTRGR